MKARSIRVATLVTFALAFGAPAFGQGCKADPEGDLVCGEGKSAVVVLNDTLSPSRQFAFAWGTGDGVTAMPPGYHDPHEVLVRLADGAVLAALGGHYWRSARQGRANREDIRAAWAPDSRAVIEVANDRWDTYALVYYALGRDDTVTRLDLLPAVETAARARFQQLHPRTGKGLDFQVLTDSPITLDAHGRARLTVLLFVPKEGNPDPGLDVVVRIDNTPGGLVARITSIRRVRDAAN